ncbi:MAG: hypothetical protein JXR78_15250 [Victivallales bacterium]|nr:hypothetical protein [Victivallales bacterium]
MLDIDLPYKYTPREYQRDFCNATSRFKRIMTVWHRRAGKDLSYISMLVPQMMKRVGLYFYVFPTAKQGKKVIWNGIDGNGMKFIDHIPTGLLARNRLGRTKVNHQEMSLELVNGSILNVIGSDNYDDTLIGTNPVGLIFSEYSLQKPEVWDYCRPILRENGGWAWFNFTPRGKNFAYNLLKRAQAMPDRWFTQVLSIDDTGVMTKADVQQEIAEGMTEARAEQEFYCSFNAEEGGLIYGREMNSMWSAKRICNLDYDPSLPLYTCWDLGVADMMCIVFFQLSGNRIHVIDFYADTGRGLKYYHDEELKRREKERSYKYTEHFAPHDIKQRDMMIQDEAGNAMTRLDGASAFGLDFTRVRRVASVWDRIDVTRGLFLRIYIDAKLEKLIDALSSYKRRLNEALSTPVNEVYDATPLHDWASHPADAFGTMADVIKQGLCGGANARNEVIREVFHRQAAAERRNGGYNPLAL